MKRKLISVLLISSMACGILSGCGAVVIEPNMTKPTDTANEDTARPQDDFYKYINQEALSKAVFKYQQNTAGSSFDQDMVNDQVKSVIKEVVKGSGYEKGSEEDIIKSAYDAYIKYDFSQEPIPEDLAAVIREVDEVKDIDGFLKADAKLCKDYGIENILRMNISVNYFVSNENVLTFHQYTGVINSDFKAMQENVFGPLDSVRDDARKVMKTLGYDDKTSEDYGLKLADVTFELFKHTDLKVMEAANDHEYVKMFSKDQINEIFTNFDLASYLDLYGLDKSGCDEFCLTDPGQLNSLNSILTADNLDALKAYKLCQIYSKYIVFIAPHYDSLKGLVPKSYLTEEDKTCEEVMKAFSAETDPIYVEKFYPDETDKALRSMCDDIKGGYRKLINDAEWLSDATRKGLLEKLENIVYVTCKDLKRHDASEYAGITGGNYYQILHEYQKIDMEKNIKSLTEPVSRYDVNMPMQMFNACYNPSANNITITSAITNKPFFDAGSDYYSNLGGLGSVIAHEMGHAFDSNCILYDKDGVYDPSWIAEEDMEKLKSRNETAKDYFEDKFKVFGVYHVNGEQTLGENYADLGGMECVCSLAKTNADLIKIFTQYAVIWCEKKTDTAIIDQLAYDEHSPEILRVNAILSSLNEFYEAYDVKEGDGMYIAPSDRISRWH